ncbi:MAG: glycosyltransferase family 39 protein [Anaerolineae bacterium]|nr:glycosyltransferase family 39 protein [Anaerolineae bacterium]
MNPKRFEPVLLAGILFAALALRLGGIGFGLPYVYHYDEHFYVNTALKLGAGVINNPPYAPTGFSNILFIEYACYYVTGKVLGLFASPQEFEVAYRTDPTIFYLLGRLTSAILGTMTVLAVYLLGKMSKGPAVGLTAAGLLAASFLHVRNSHHSVPDIAMAFFVVLTVMLAVASDCQGKRRYLYLAGLSGGLAVAMKWSAFPIAITLAGFGIWMQAKTRDKIAGKIPNRIALFTILSFGSGFVLGSPQILYNPAPYLREAINQQAAGQAGGFGTWQVDTLPGWLFYGETLVYGMGLILVVLGLVGGLQQLAIAIRERDGTRMLLLSFPIIYFAFMGATSHYFARYALAMMPFVALSAAEILIALVTRFRVKRNGLAQGVIVALAALAIAQPLAYSIRHDALLTRQDTRTLAKEWIELHIPAGAKIAVDWPVHGPPLSTPERAVPNGKNVYDVLDVGGTGLYEHPIEWYYENGFDYLIASSFIYRIPLVYADVDSERREFYAWLDNHLERMQEIRPHKGNSEPPFEFDQIYGPYTSLWRFDRPGPTLKIYALRRP